MQAKTYLSASMQFEQKQSKSKCKQRLLECEDRVLGDNITKSEHEKKKKITQSKIYYTLE